MLTDSAIKLAGLKTTQTKIGRVESTYYHVSLIKDGQTK